MQLFQQTVLIGHIPDVQANSVKRRGICWLVILSQHHSSAAQCISIYLIFVHLSTWLKVGSLSLSPAPTSFSFSFTLSVTQIINAVAQTALRAAQNMSRSCRSRLAFIIHASSSAPHLTSFAPRPPRMHQQDHSWAEQLATLQLACQLQTEKNKSKHNDPFSCR